MLSLSHVAEGHRSGLIRHTYFRLCALLHTRSGALRANHLGAKLDTDVCKGDDPMAMIPSKVAPCDIATTKPTARAGHSFFSCLIEAVMESYLRQEYREIARYQHL